MSESRRDDGRAVFLLVLLLNGISPQVIPFGFMPPAFLEIVPQGGVSATDITGRDFRVKEVAFDVHFRKLGSRREGNPAHAYWHHRTGHVSEENDPNILARAARGEFECYSHLYGGEGTIGNSDAQVEVFTRRCSRKTYVVLPDYDQDIWPVARLRISGGDVSLVNGQYCRNSVLLRAGGDVPRSRREGVKL